MSARTSSQFELHDPLETKAKLAQHLSVGVAGIAPTGFPQTMGERKESGLPALPGQPAPFGYLVGLDDHFGLDDSFHGGMSILSESENQNLQNFFTQTDPYAQTAPLQDPPANEMNDQYTSSNWGSLGPPPDVLGVAANLPDQSLFQHGFSEAFTFTPPPSAARSGSMQDNMQGTLALFENMPSSFFNARAGSFHGMPSATTDPSNMASMPYSMLEMPPHGPVAEQITSLLPNAHRHGSVDAQLAAEIVASNASERTSAQMAQLQRQRPSLRRSYTYGTDSAFNPSGFQLTSPHETHEHIEQRLLHDLSHAHSVTMQHANGADRTNLSPAARVFNPPSSVDADSPRDINDGDNSHDDGPARKRRKSNPDNGTGGATKAARKNTSTTRSRKTANSPTNNQPAKKKRASNAGQKAPRENLSEEQKRANHILSEQKRRTHISRGYVDLGILVPELRSSGHSKSEKLKAVANFLEELVADNERYRQVLDGTGTTGS